MAILILGAGGHATVVADILIQAFGAGREELRPLGFLDDDRAKVGSSILELPVVGGTGELSDIDHSGVIVAIGDNETRAHVFAEMVSRGERIVSAVHPNAVIAEGVQLGRGVMVCAGAVVNSASEIGDDVIVNTGARIDHHNVVGSHVHVAPGVVMGGAVTVGEGALVGLGASVLPGRTIGPWGVVGAGSVVVEDVPARATVIGVPARVVRRQS